ncbi:hypothetical protein Sango_2999200 [Sesamum angolense]|uniref:Uncharacterized protein n=1 Tax=Sesamum angolense TaxID=2727404 RepID=A0AAE1T4M7_9LAMI|nr:hypothetical protein Sango_2999200 [Sesamum angolense]
MLLQSRADMSIATKIHVTPCMGIISQAMRIHCSKKKDSSNADDCMSTITFTDEDLLLGSKPHNHPLFIVGYVREQKVNRILIDGESAVNILPLRIVKELGIPIDELSNSRLMIQASIKEDKGLSAL